MIAIRDGFIAIMPVTMVGSIAVLLNVFLRDLPNEWLGEGNGFVAAMDPIIAINGNVSQSLVSLLRYRWDTICRSRTTSIRLRVLLLRSPLS